MIATLVATPLACASAPIMFSPGRISGPAHDAAPAFTPDGKTIYFGRSTPQASFILVSHRIGLTWTVPKLAPFSGRWSDMEPALAPDGSYLVFASNRPAADGAAPLGRVVGGTLQKEQGGNLWRVKWVGTHWGTPKRLPDAINANSSTFAPSIAANGDLYFMRADGPSARFRLFRAEALGKGDYAAPDPLSFSDGSTTDVDPTVAPDHSFIVFGSNRHANKDIDLFISRWSSGSWSAPEYLGGQINSPTSDAEPRLGRDGHTLYYSSERMVPVAKPMTPSSSVAALRASERWNNGLYNIWRVDLRPHLTGAC